MGRVAALALGALLPSLPLADAHALVKAGPGIMRGLNVRMGPASSAAPLDGFTTPTAAYSFRKLKSTYAGNAVRLRRASDNAELDVGFLGFTGFTGAPWDSAAATAHCAATTCFVRTWYDQSGNARDMAQTTQANQPPLIFNCQGTLPCLEITATNFQLANAASLIPADVSSISVAANRTVGTGTCQLLRLGGATSNRLLTGGANLWTGGGLTGTISAAAADTAWHAAQVVVNGASSNVSIDGTVTTGTITSSTASATPLFNVVTVGTTCRWAELVFWSDYALTAGEQTTLTNNQRAYWGF